MKTLNNLKAGEFAMITSIEADESLFHRLNALGFRIGKKIEVVRRASFNGPIQVRIGATEIILRLSEAQRIEVNQS
jgi:ferrous iron transport protein A